MARHGPAVTETNRRKAMNWTVHERDGRFYAVPESGRGEVEVVSDGHGAWLEAKLGFYVCSA